MNIFIIILLLMSVFGLINTKNKFKQLNNGASDYNIKLQKINLSAYQNMLYILLIFFAIIGEVLSNSYFDFIFFVLFIYTMYAQFSSKIKVLVNFYK